MSVEGHTIHSFDEAIQTLYHDDWNPEISRHRSFYAFRGMVNSDWGMPTSLMRVGGAYATIERHLLRNFQKYAHRDVVERDSFWHWLTVAQHHGLPTRLLDWTYSPLVALHFATDDLSSMETDGVVWCAKIPDAHRQLPKGLSSALEIEGSFVFTVDMLARLEERNYSTNLFGLEFSTRDLRKAGLLRPGKIQSLADFDRLKDEPFAMFFEPPSLDDRIVNQFALFSVISDVNTKMDDWLAQHPKGVRKIIIPADAKWEIRDKLDQANITERVIFPGLDGLSRWLKRHYSPSV